MLLVSAHPALSCACPVVFSVYDVDADGLISIDDLTTVLKSLVGNNLEDTEIADLANNTVEEFDVDGDDCLSLAEFRRVRSETAPQAVA